MSDLGPPYGFALRSNNHCAGYQVSSGETLNDVHRCCPNGTTFGNARACCPDEDDCTEDITNPPHCADRSWDLFNNTRDGGFFCCLSGTKGFYYRSKQAVGCIDDSDAPTNPEYQILTTYSTGVVATSTTFSTSASSTATATSEPDYNESTSPSTSNTGAIAGGVVGGVAGLAIILALLWCFMRRRSQKQASQEETPITKGPDIPSELHGQSYVAELDSSARQTVHELPGFPMAHEKG